jgi:hypothetical protein
MSRRFQFSLRAMLVVTTLICVGLAIFLDRIRAIESINALDGICWYDLGDGYPGPLEPTASKWRRCFVGIVYPVVEVEVPPTQKTFDERRETLSRSGDGVMWFGLMRVGGRDFTDRDLAACLRFPRLKRLDISFSKVSDAGVESLARMHALRYLDLRGTLVTPTGVDRLKSCLPQCQISH